MKDFSSYTNDSLNFQQIILNYLRKIMDLNLRLVTQEANLDFVMCFRRAVLGLSDVLLPFFDKQMSAAYDLFLMENKEIIKKTTDGQIVTDAVEYCNGNMKSCRDLFRALNLLLRRNDYLKSEVYGEDKDELVDDEDEEGKE